MRHARTTTIGVVLLASCGGSSSTVREEPREARREAPSDEPQETAAPPDAEATTTDAPAGSGAVLEGLASYYHDSLAGNRTANGERYRLDALTAASRDLPFGTMLRVVRVDNDRSVVVRVNDRGPFGDHRRILDLSRAAARELDMLRAGVVRVRVYVLERNGG